MAIHTKQKAGRGAVFSLTTDPSKWYYRELVAGTKRYQYKLIPNAETLQQALDGFMVIYDEFRKDGQPAPAPVRRRAGKTIADYIEDYVQWQAQRVETGEITRGTYVNKKFMVQKHLAGYLNWKEITKVSQLDDLTFEDYPFYRKDARKQTRQKELVEFKVFIETFLLKRKLVVAVPALPKTRIRAHELDANPPMDAHNWNKMSTAIKKYKAKTSIHNNHRGWYFASLFYRFTIVAKNCGLRPNELMNLRWCDVVRENVRRINSKGEEVDDWIVHINVRQSKTGRQRTVPCRGVDEQLQQWRKEQLDYIAHYKLNNPRVHDPETVIFCNLYNEYRSYCHANYTRAWDLAYQLVEALKPYKFSDRRFTLYSLRTTYINNRIIEGKDIYTVSKLAGHTIGVCERYYARLDLALKSKEITEVQFGVTGKRKKEMVGY